MPLEQYKGSDKVESHRGRKDAATSREAYWPNEKPNQGQRNSLSFKYTKGTAECQERDLSEKNKGYNETDDSKQCKL